jgi:hypothetical protein
MGILPQCDALVPPVPQCDYCGDEYFCEQPAWYDGLRCIYQTGHGGQHMTQITWDADNNYSVKLDRD